MESALQPKSTDLEVQPIPKGSKESASSAIAQGTGLQIANIIRKQTEPLAIKETTTVTQPKPKKEKKSEAVTSKFESTVQVERESILFPHGLEKVNELSEISQNQELSSSDKSLEKAKTTAFLFQHEITQTDAHFKFIGKQKRANKFVGVQVNPTPRSIQDQGSQDKEMTKPNLQLQLNQNLAGIIQTKIRAAPGATLGQ